MEGEERNNSENYIILLTTNFGVEETASSSHFLNLWSQFSHF